MRKFDGLTTFLAGIGVGVTAVLALSPSARRSLNRQARHLETAAGEMVEECQVNLCAQRAEGTERINEMRDKAMQKLDEAAEAAKKAAALVIDRSKELAHDAGRKMEVGAKILQDV